MPTTDTNWLLETSANLGASSTWQPVPGQLTRSNTNEAQSVSSPSPTGYFRLRKP